jgi:hypothetical protein
LEIQNIPAGGIEAGNLVFLDQPHDQRSKNLAESHEQKSSERAYVENRDPLTGIRGIHGRGRRFLMQRVVHAGEHFSDPGGDQGG